MLKNGTTPTPQHKPIGLPLIPFEFIAGHGEDNKGIALNECERYYIPEFENIGAEFIVRVGGSSMYPKYSSGDLLACRKIKNILFFQWGKIYIIDSSQGQLIKRVFEHENEELITLVSDNKEKYPPFSIPKDDIRSLSIVLGAVRVE
jgi:phage repressor protein C with HTH and peptisase S24 domain